MNRKCTDLFFVSLLLSLFPIQIPAAETNKGLERYQTLENTLSFQQRFFVDAKSKVGVTPERERALSEFRLAVEQLRKSPKENLSTKELDLADQKLLHLETFLAPEGLKISQLERAEEMKTLSRLPKSAGTGWQPGVSTLSFGRFGWDRTDGLLCDTVALDAIQTTEKQKELGRLSNADLQVSVLGCDLRFPETAIGISLVPKGAAKIDAKVTGTTWIGKTFAITDSEAKGKTAGTIYTSLQRPATRFDYHVPAVTCSLQTVDFEKSSLGYFEGKSFRQINLPAAKPIHTLTRPWLLLDLAEQGNNQHILIVLQFQKKLKEIEIQPGKIILTAASGPIGNIWVFRPWGVERKSRAEMTAGLFKRIDNLCRLNLAWPKRCDEFFRIDYAKNQIDIRNDVEFETLADDWQTEPMADAAVPPMIMLAKLYKAPIKITEPVTNWTLPTKYGHFATVKGPVLEYTLPLPPLYRHGVFAIEKEKEWIKLLHGSDWQYQGSVEGSAPDWAYRGVASPLQAWNYLTPELLAKFTTISDNIKTNLTPEHFWKKFKWRMDPLTGRRYCYDYPGNFYTTGLVNDINWNNALVLYGLDQWAAYTGQWKTLDQAWPDLRLLMDFFVKSHDWAWMADSITEIGEGAAIDCLTADYAGLIAAARIAQTLGKQSDADRALYLAAKTAYPHTMRFAFLSYIQEYNLWHSDSPNIGTINGFHEFNAWIHPKHSDPWWGMCSLSGFGVEPECFDAMMLYLPKSRIVKWWQMVTKIYPEWYKVDKPYKPGTIYGGNTNYITTPALYLEFRLGANNTQLMSWAKRAGLSDGCFANHNVFAEIASRECPIQIIDWGQCTFDHAKYDPAKKLAVVTFTNTTSIPQTITLAGAAVPNQILLNTKPVEFSKSVDHWGKPLIKFSLPPGTHPLSLTGFE
jgi:hypothetical protein